jgi:general secretion pathway protein C
VSRKDELRARALAALAVAGAAVRGMWSRPSRRPLLVGLVIVPVLGLAALMSTPRGTAAQSASPSPSPAESVEAPPPPAPRAEPTDAKEFVERNPFRVLKDREKTAPPPPPPTVEPTRPPPPRDPIDASTKLELKGTFVMGKDRYAVVVIKQKNEEVVVKEDESPLPNSRIIRINPREVRLLLDGQEAVLRLEFISRNPGAGVVTPVAPSVVSNPYAVAPPVPDMPQLPPGADGQAKRLPRQEVDQQLDNLNQLLTQVNIQPVFQGGQPSGFRLTDIQRGTILDQIGIQDGDTLRFVNGQRIDSVQSAFQLYNILKESTNVEITVIRNTRPVTLRYLIY